jgi:hypothetical protein
VAAVAAELVEIVSPLLPVVLVVAATVQNDKQLFR